MLETLPRFPCRANKRPLTGHGFLDAAFEDYSGWPLVGVPTGAASGLDVLDVDLEGVRWFDQHYDQLPPTRAHETRSGGRHLIFRHSEDLCCSASRIAPGVDVRADGGYVVWWPREGFRVVSDAPVAEWPDWLVGLARVERASAENPTVVTSQYLPTWQEAISNHHQSASRWSREETFALYALRNAMQRVSSAPLGKRESALNGESYSLGRLVGAGWISLSRVASGLEHAIRSNLNRSHEGLTFLEEHGIDFVRWKILRALHDGMARPYPKL